MGTAANPLGFKQMKAALEANYTAMRVADNLAPNDVKGLLTVISNLGFPAPAVTVGTEDANHVSLGLADYLKRGADPNYAVSIQLSWPNVSGAQLTQASTLYAAFANGIWEGFQTMAASVYPGKAATELRALAFEQIPALERAFTEQMAAIASRGLDHGTTV